MQNKKLRVGLISENTADAAKLKSEYPDTYVTHARNVIELHRNCGQNKLNAIIFLQFPNLEEDFFSFHQFLRSKKDFQGLPIAILSSSPLLFAKPLADRLVRNFQAGGNLFLPLLNFFNSLQNEQTLNELISQEKIEHEFISALGQKLGQDTDFLSRIATYDEAHESFLCQLSEEISTNLLWMKFSARILENGSEQLKKVMESSSDAELQEYIEHILSLAFGEFHHKLKSSLGEMGAVSFVSSDVMEANERLAFIKTSEAFPLIFESKMCSILLEVIRYI